MAKTVLVVDDAPGEVARVSGLLRGAGYECFEAFNGADAVRIAIANHPDLVLMDVVMGDEDGFKACRSIKADPSSKDIPVVFVTAKNDENARWWGKRIGAVAYVAKPVKPADLLEVVRRFI